MLLRFIVKNHTSFREEAELSFISTARKDTPDLRFESKHAKHGVLPVVGIWGANASGKSNLLKALLFMRDAVANSHAHWLPGGAVPWLPWRLQVDEHTPSTRMELEFLIDDVRHLLGFKIGPGANGQACFTEEWLYRWESSRRQVLYHRDADQDEAFYFGPGLGARRHLRQVEAFTRGNSLFLSVAAQLNHPILLPVHQALGHMIEQERPLGLNAPPRFHPDNPMLSASFRPALLTLLSTADLGICDVRLETVKAQLLWHEAFGEMPDSAKFWNTRIVFTHQTNQGDRWELPPEQESRGTHALLARISDIVRIMNTGGLLVIDEIDTSLHPDLCAALVDLFTSADTNPAHAQLLFTTHDRGLLSRLRTDEVVLVDKSCGGESTLRTASDYRDLRTRDDLRTAHEQGRIGGVPALGDWSSTAWTKK